ncbi:MAG: imelysin family protein [Pseudomonadota bacterium]|nr:imelysin family protein [Pseudomonadota bacterium]
MLENLSSSRIHRLAAARRVRQATLLALLGSAGAVSQAQTVAPNVAVPFYAPGHFMQGAYRDWYAPQAAGFATQSGALPGAVAALCDAAPADAPGRLAQARAQWQASTVAWERLSSVQIGPLVQRRSARQIDFTPTRPELITRAIQSAPADAAAMERIGTPAKGLPALEWLLWSRPVAPQTPACRYAVQVAADIAREAGVLSSEFASLAARELGEEEETSVPAMGELVNQWVGGLERLRWTHMEKPRLSDASGGHNATPYPRSASGQSAASWAAQWQGLRTLATASASAQAPLPGQGLVPLETYLRGRGLNAVANKLAHSVAQADKALHQLSPGNKAGLGTATRALAALKKLAETDVAPALEVNIGFSDADGD